MMNKILIIFLLIWVGACKNSAKPVETSTPPVKLRVPTFLKDSAYSYVQSQVDFGARVPGTAAHKACGDWIVQRCKDFGAQVIEQKFPGQTYTGLKFEGRNIIASFNPAIKSRIVLASHWDSRFLADHDPDKSKRSNPVMGADDGGSGVGILLEIARQLQATPITNLGIDLLFFDGEDQGGEGGEAEDWCLGSQYWSKNKHVAGYQARFGILMDMVGAKAPRFTKEGTSVSYAGAITDKVWLLAQRMGYGNYYVNENSPPIIDDHYFINRISGIPMVDIINRPTNDSFMKCWHTTCDDMSIIDPESLKATGQVVLAVIYREANGEF
ncbi:MAG: M28 family peptidase [Saprospiraceae bacterium]|jgi:hypothetical protein|nr:M28 family peptidase [Saprospiraceae bacterium]MBK7439759.1 M28 family peptidase [Saprospiraceae bacterium]MBK9681556.1 M28 family peptidase [Saprospiraceae bacterium]MBK9928890.1 M28 family peptidase [Saprospiraceae bacterium]MBL0110692.1 M28 family peptidase [Saprospiraceae bacterium]